jgi:hypothetical protein
MPPKNDPAHRHSKPAPPTRRKSKPKFEVPVETGASATPVAWAYRTDDAPPPPPAARRQTEDSSKANPILVAGMWLFCVGATAVGLISLVALGLVATPFGFSKGLLARDHSS